MEKNDELKLVFAPGCFDGFEGTQEELDSLVKQITESFNNGTLFSESEEVDMVTLEEEHPDIYEQLQEVTAAETTKRLH